MNSDLLTKKRQNTYLERKTFFTCPSAAYACEGVWWRVCVCVGVCVCVCVCVCVLEDEDASERVISPLYPYASKSLFVRINHVNRVCNSQESTN